ncbi:XdhC family protein [Sinorhizobium meliloti]|nr:XdhC family protein [Sinorhizobium meliloti]
MTAPVPIQVRVRDDDAEVLKFAVDAFRHGGAALATLVEIRGGAARAIGSQIAVAADGSFCGYVSGGCVEAAVCDVDATPEQGYLMDRPRVSEVDPRKAQ